MLSAVISGSRSCSSNGALLTKRHQALCESILNCTRSLSTLSLERHNVSNHQLVSVRNKHSNRQIKTRFENRARVRIMEKMGIMRKEEPIPESTFEPICEPKILSNGWSKPPDVPLPAYPFKVGRTVNKPNDSVGFLPVYTKRRKDGTKSTTLIKKVSGDHNAFTQELRAVLQLPTMVGRNETIKYRTGGTIEVNGQYVKKVKAWLAGLGF